MADEKIADFCTNCGNPNTEKNRLCSKCGVSLVKPENPQIISPQQNANKTGIQKRRKLLIVGFIACIVITVMGGILLFEAVSKNVGVTNPTDSKSAMEQAKHAISERSGIVPKTNPLIDALKNPEVAVPCGIMLIGLIGIVGLGVSYKKTDPS
jgi:hypothetical protein